LVGAALSKISVVLYRVKEQAPTRALTTRVPLGTQFERELREVTRVSRIPAAALPSSLRKAPRRRSK
jgi:Ni,Fe-hydrogenase III component G